MKRPVDDESWLEPAGFDELAPNEANGFVYCAASLARLAAEAVGSALGCWELDEGAELSSSANGLTAAFGAAGIERKAEEAGAGEDILWNMPEVDDDEPKLLPAPVFWKVG